MAKAAVKKSKRGRDLVVLTMGPKEAAKLEAVLAAWVDDVNLGEIADALGNVSTNNTLNAEIKMEVQIIA
jgi:hypothetical protein